MKMCKHLNIAQRYADGECLDFQKLFIEGHVKSCEQCATLIDENRRLAGILQKQAIPYPESDYYEGILGRLGDNTVKNSGMVDYFNVSARKLLPFAAGFMLFITSLAVALGCFEKLPNERIEINLSHQVVSTSAKTDISVFAWYEMSGVENEIMMSDDNHVTTAFYDILTRGDME